MRVSAVLQNRERQHTRKAVRVVAMLLHVGIEDWRRHSPVETRIAPVSCGSWISSFLEVRWILTCEAGPALSPFVAIVAIVREKVLCYCIRL